MRLAILDADILREALRPRYDSYGRMFVELFRRIGMGWEMDTYSVIEGEYPASPEDYDAFLITGSQHDAFGSDAWIVRLGAYIQERYREGKPLVGVCFGHQLLAKVLGGRVGRAGNGWGLGVMEYQMEEVPDFTDAAGPVKLLVSHRDQVTQLPAQAWPLLSNEFCPFAGFYIPHRVLAIQGHPEFSVDYARELMYYRRDQVPEEQLLRAQESLRGPHEGDRVGGWMRAFLQASATS